MDNPYLHDGLHMFRGKSGLHFSCVIRDSLIPFEADIESDTENPEERYFIGFVLTEPYFSMSIEDFVEYRRVFWKYRNLMNGYYNVCATNYSYPYKRTFLEPLLTLPLDEHERQQVEKFLADLTCIYLIRDIATGLTKIGRSNSPEQRLKQLIKQDTLLPTPNQFIILFTWEDYGYKEQFLHNTYAEKRVRGEWFNLDDADIDSIRADADSESEY